MDTGALTREELVRRLENVEQENMAAQEQIDAFGTHRRRSAADSLATLPFAHVYAGSFLGSEGEEGRTKAI